VARAFTTAAGKLLGLTLDWMIAAAAILSFVGLLKIGSGPYAEGSPTRSKWPVLLVLLAALVARYLWIVFRDPKRKKRVIATIVFFAFLLGSFSAFYYAAGRAVPAHYLRSHTRPPSRAFQAFGEPISRVDAFYFAVGTMTTGAGSLTPKSTETRLAASIQMLCDLALLGLGLAAVLRESSDPS